MSAAPSVEQLRQRVGAVTLARFLGSPCEVQDSMLNAWRTGAKSRQNHASPMVRLEAKERLERCDAWEAFATEPPEAPALPTAA